jgi:glycosyltransferase involved in cell wall biosynthesis
LRIAIVVLEDFPGAQNRVQRQALALKSEGHDLRIYAAAGESTEDVWQDIPVERSWLRRRKVGGMRQRLWEYTAFTWSTFWWCLRLSLSWRPDVVQFASMPDWLVWCGLPCRWLVSSKLVLDLHELMPELLDTQGAHPTLRRVLLLLERWSVVSADLVLVPTTMCADALSGRVSGIEPITILNGVDTDRFVRRQKAPAREGRFRVGYHGTVSWRFGVHTVVDAVALLASQGVPIEMVIAGDGDSREAIERGVAEKGLSEVIRFLGQQPATEIPRIASSFDVAVVPYEDSEFMRLAYPTKAFEHAALGVPMIMSDLTSTRGLFGEDEVCFVVAGDVPSWANAIETLIRSPEKLGEYAEHAHRRVQVEYTWNLWSGRYVQAMGRVATSS